MSKAASLTGDELIPIVQAGGNKTTTVQKVKEGLATVTQLNNKVDKDGDKVLSDKNFTTNYETKLSNIADNATKTEKSDTNGNIKINNEEINVYTHPDNHPATMITQDGSHRFVTDGEKSTWNNKASKVVEVAGSTGEVTQEINPNTFYKFGECTTLNITLGAKVDGIYNEYMFQFRSGATPTVLGEIAGVSWVGDNTIKANTTYVVVIHDGILAALGGA